MDPYVIWGTGEQDRNFTYVQDIVDALVSAAEKVEDGSPVNAGRSDRLTINQAIDLVFELVGWKPKMVARDTSKPQGVASRAADGTKASNVLKWMPKVTYRDGFQKTIDWYFANHRVEAVKSNLDRLLLER
jgi:UDP-glucose 4-epimerase